MAMSLSQMQDFVRTHADADIEDAPNSSLEVYGRIAYRDILSRRDQWPHLQMTGTLTVSAGNNTYPLSAVIGGGSLDEVTSIVDQTTIGRRLIYMSRADGDLAFGYPASAGSETALAYTIEGDNIVLFPTPSATRTYTVRGIRAPGAWPAGAGSLPDLPESLHEAIAWYMLSSYFMAQEDTQLAGAYLSEYNMMVERHIRSESMKEYSARVPVMGGQNYKRPSFSRWVRGMIEN